MLQHKNFAFLVRLRKGQTECFKLLEEACGKGVMSGT